MRIIAGRLKGRRITAPAGRVVRPTTDRVREALFNRLAHAPWARDAAPFSAETMVLDGFCGSGAMGLEAISRGCGFAYFLDTSPQTLAIARANAESLDVADRCRFIRGDATAPPGADRAATLVLLDPPYGKDLAASALAGLNSAGWIAPGALVVVEIGRKDTAPVVAGFELLDDRRYGDTRVVCFACYPTPG